MILYSGTQESEPCPSQQSQVNSMNSDVSQVSSQQSHGSSQPSKGSAMSSQIESDLSTGHLSAGEGGGRAYVRAYDIWKEEMRPGKFERPCIKPVI